MLPLPRERMKCKKIWRNPSRITYSFGFPRFTTISEYVHLSTSVSRVFLNIRACSSAIQENFHTFLTVGRVCNMVLETQETREKKPRPENSGLGRVSLNKISGFSGHKIRVRFRVFWGLLFCYSGYFIQFRPRRVASQ